MRVSTLYISLPDYDLSFTCCREGLGCRKQAKILTSEHSTLRRHAASLHSVSSTILIFLFCISIVLLPSDATESGAKKTSLTLCYPKIRSNAGKPSSIGVSRHPKRVSPTISSLKPRNRLHKATNRLRVPQSTGLFRQIKQVFFHLTPLNAVLNLWHHSSHCKHSNNHPSRR